MNTIKIYDIEELDSNNSVLYQKHYKAKAVLHSIDSDKEISFEFLVELTPLDYNYYIKKIINSDVDLNVFSEAVIPAIIKIHSENNIINF